MGTVKIEVTTPECKDGEAYIFELEESALEDQAKAIDVLYPDWTEIYIIKSD